jgi:hypothetical protein
MRRLATAAALAVALTMSTACGGGEDDVPSAGSGSAPDEVDLDELEDEVGDALDEAGIDVPDICLSQFIGLMSTPDLARVGLPGSWPEPPVQATLCKTEGDREIEEIGYATDATPVEVLDAYADALADHGPERTEGDGYGAGTLTGIVDGVGFVIQPRTGSYEILVGSP